VPPERDAGDPAAVERMRDATHRALDGVLGAYRAGARR
jgi:hypothetical protein